MIVTADIVVAVPNVAHHYVKVYAPTMYRGSIADTVLVLDGPGGGVFTLAFATYNGKPSPYVPSAGEFAVAFAELFSRRHAETLAKLADQNGETLIIQVERDEVIGLPTLELGPDGERREDFTLAGMYNVPTPDSYNHGDNNGESHDRSDLEG